MEGKGAFVSAIEGLLDRGRLVLQTYETPSPGDLRAAERALIDFERRYRLEIPGEPPPLVTAAAVWGAEMFFRACQCLVFRQIDEAGVNELLHRPFREEQNASAHYSVDLTFRFLPDLCQRAKAASRDDPLVERLADWANAWPLSSVGIPGANPQRVDPILEHPSL